MPPPLADIEDANAERSTPMPGGGNSSFAQTGGSQASQSSTSSGRRATGSNGQGQANMSTCEHAQTGGSQPSQSSTSRATGSNGQGPANMSTSQPQTQREDTNNSNISPPKQHRQKNPESPKSSSSPGVGHSPSSRSIHSRQQSKGGTVADGWTVQKWEQHEDWISGQNHLIMSEESMELLLNVGRMVQREQDTKIELHTMHIKSISLVVLATVAIGVSMVWLRVVLIPFILAVFFMFLLEPLLFSIMNPYSVCKRCSKRARRRAEMSEQERLRYFATAVATSPTKPLQPVIVRSNGSDEQPGNGTDYEDDEDEKIVGCQEKTEIVLKQLSWKAWGVFSVAACIIVLLASIVGIVYLIVKSIEDFPWEKYQKSPRLKMLIEWIPNLGADPENLDFSALIPWMMQGPLVEAIGMTFSILSTALLMLLFLAFLLINDLASGEDDSLLGLRKKLRLSVRRYIIIKSAISVAVACIIGFVLYCFKVDLAFVFAVLTLILNYIPHVGSTIAILAPLPLVWLDPTKTITDLVNVFIIPLVIHQVVGNVIEPKLLSVSLELHPIVVILSLAFWTTIWGTIGAVLSVPLTAVLRLVLKDFSHPYVVPIVCLLEGRWETFPMNGANRRKRPRLLASSGSSSGNAHDPWSPIALGDFSPKQIPNHSSQKKSSKRAAYMRPGLAKSYNSYSRSNDTYDYRSYENGSMAHSAVAVPELPLPNRHGGDAIAKPDGTPSFGELSPHASSDAEKSHSETHMRL